MSSLSLSDASSFEVRSIFFHENQRFKMNNIAKISQAINNFKEASHLRCKLHLIADEKPTWCNQITASRLLLNVNCDRFTIR